jgi:hypothetical protein
MKICYFRELESMQQHLQELKVDKDEKPGESKQPTPE